MMVRTILIGILAAAASVYAQPGFSGGRGPGGPGGARMLGAEVGFPGRVVKNAPYSAEVVTETTQTLPDGNRIRQTNSSRFYRDGEGRTRREQSLKSLNGLAPNSDLQQAVFINDPVAHTNYALNPADKTARKSTWDSPVWRGPRGNTSGDSGSPSRLGRGAIGQDGTSLRPGMRRNSQNVKTESLGKQTIEGVIADGTRTTMTIPAGQIGNE